MEEKFSNSKSTIVPEVSPEVKQRQYIQALKQLKEAIQNPERQLKLSNRSKQYVHQIQLQSKSREAE